MENSSILVFQNKVCYLDYLLTLKTPKGQIVTVIDRFIEIRLPFNFIDSIPKEFTDYYTLLYNSKEHLNSDFYFSIGIIRDGRYYRKKSGNIINYLKNNLEHIRIGLYPEGYKKYSNITMLLGKEEYMPSEDCKELLLEFHESTSSHPVLTVFEKMIDNIIRKIY